MTMMSAVSRLRAFVSVALLAVPVAIQAQGTATTNDPRVGLKAGLNDAGTAAKGLMLLSHSPKADSLGANAPLGGLTFANSDLAFSGNTVVQGNFSGFIAWDVSNPAHPVMRKAFVCPTDQGDPTIVGHLLFISDETTRGRVDCGSQGTGHPDSLGVMRADSVSKDRARGVRIFDISDINHPRQITVVQTCRGSHTHTLVQDPNDKNNVYIYVSGSAGVRSPNELKGCSDASPDSNPNSSRFRIDVIKVPLAHPEQARVVSSPRLFDSLMHAGAHGLSPADTAGGAQGRGGRGGGVRNLPANLQLRTATTAVDSARITKTVDSLKTAGFTINIVDGVATILPPAGGRGGGRGGVPRTPMGPEQCHDITVYPTLGLGAGACGQYGLLLDISKPANPKRVAAVSDTNFAFWHSATFSNDGTKLLFTDEWGGGTQPKCRAGDPLAWGGDALFTLDKKTRKLTPGAYYKIPQVQTSMENCVAHNGGLIPIPGRDILVQGWYQGGVSIMDFTDVNHPKEIAYFDRGPVSDTMLVIGGFWGAYYYNGHIYASEIARGFDVFDLTPTDQLSQNEIDAAKLVHFKELNPQDQPKIVWPAAFPVVRSYLDQLARDNGLSADRRTKIGADLDAAEKLTGAKRKSALTKLAASIDKDVASSSDARRVRMTATAVRDLAK
jgi:hypothetical protein